jgi:hypothetical protein
MGNDTSEERNEAFNRTNKVHGVIKQRKLFLKYFYARGKNAATD